jgi:putative Mg2+ transporter-C (MgtC) family protein
MFWDADVIGRIAAAVALGAVVGFEREAMDQPAGLRTHITVCLGACLFGVISTLGFDEFQAVRSTTNIQIDVTRVASQVVVGIGFLGAGMIYRQGLSVHNLTTAASLWVTAAIGLASGVGDIGAATVATIALVVSLVVLRFPRELIRRRVSRDRGEVRIKVLPGTDPGAIISALRSIDEIDVESVVLEKEDGVFLVRAGLHAEPRTELDQVLSSLATREDVASLTILE